MERLSDMDMLFIDLYKGADRRNDELFNDLFNRFKELLKRGHRLTDRNLTGYILCYNDAEYYLPLLRYGLDRKIIDPRRMYSIYPGVEYPLLFFCRTPSQAQLIILYGGAASLYYKFGDRAKRQQGSKRSVIMIRYNIIRTSDDPHYIVGHYLAKVHMSAFRIQRKYRRYLLCRKRPRLDYCNFG